MTKFMWPMSLALLLLVLSDLALARTYVVKHGDTLSGIALREYQDSRPIYGLEGRLARILSVNPQVKDPNALSIGELIVLDLGMERTVAQEDENQVEPQPDKMTKVLVPSVEPEHAFSLSAELGFSYFKIEATDKSSGGKSIFLSSLLPEISIKGSQKISHEVSLESSLAYRTLKMEPLDSGQSQSHPDGLTRISFGLVKEKFEESFRMAVASSSRPFIRTLSVNSFRLDAVSIPSLSMAWRRNLLAYNQTRLSMGLNLSYLFPAEYLSYDIKTGHSLDLQLGAQTSYSNFIFSQDVYYFMGSQDSGITKQRTSELGLRISLTRLF